jgi:hypothetical protein
VDSGPASADGRGDGDEDGERAERLARGLNGLAPGQSRGEPGGEALAAWSWAIAVAGYLVAPVICFFAMLGIGLGSALGGVTTAGEQVLGEVAAAGLFLGPIVTWIVTLVLHRRRRALGQKSVDGTILNWIGGLVLGTMAVIAFGLFVQPRVTERLERLEQERVEEGAGLSEQDWTPQPDPEPTWYDGAEATRSFAEDVMIYLQSWQDEDFAIREATSSAEMVDAVERKLPAVDVVTDLPFEYDAVVTAQEGTPSSAHGGRVNMRVDVRLEAGAGEIRRGAEDSWTMGHHVSCWGFRVDAHDSITDAQEIECETADSIGDLPMVAEPLPSVAEILDAMAGLEGDIDAADAGHIVQEDVAGARQVEAVRDGDALVLAVDMVSECVVGVREEGVPPREFKGYLRAGPAYRSVGCSTRLYTEVSPGR